MPIANTTNLPPKAPNYPQAAVSKIAQPEYKTALVDTKVTPVSALLAHIEGSSWIVEYYRQAIGENEELTAYQPGQLAIYQQYVAIRNFEIKVSTPLGFNQDINSTSFSVSGSAVLYPFVIPNEGDTFLADVGDGRTGQFTVDRVTRKTILKETCYEIEYTLSRYLTEEIHKDLKDRVVKTLYFERDLLTFGQSPVIAESSFNDKKKITRLLDLLVNQYLQSFFSNEYRTLLVPGQSSATYDPYVVNAFLRLHDHYKYPQLKKIKELNVDGRPIMSISNFWNVLLGAHEGMLSLGIQKMRMVSNKAFSNMPLHESIFFSRISQVIYPTDFESTVDNDYKDDCLYRSICDCIDGYDLGGLVSLEDMDWDLRSLLFNMWAGGLDEQNTGESTVNPQPLDAPWIHPVTIDDYYVLSGFFYNNASIGQSQLEMQVTNLIHQRPIDRYRVFQLCDSMNSWGRLEKFYYTPIMIVLLKMCTFELS